jgi:hypothetical protein
MKYLIGDVHDGSGRWGLGREGALARKRFCPSDPRLDVRPKATELRAHTAPVTTLAAFDVLLEVVTWRRGCIDEPRGSGNLAGAECYAARAN